MDELAASGWFRSRLPASIDLQALRADFEACFAARAGRIGHENVAQLDAAAIAAAPALAAVADHVAGLMADAREGLEFSKLWLVESSARTTAADVVPFLPHIDRARFVKAMIYLDDVGAADGPLTMASAPPEALEDRRLALGDDYKAAGGNVIHEAHEYTPLTGSAGELFVFDTNAPHLAGRVEEAGSRRVLRFDYCLPDWNRPPSPLARLRAALRRRLGR